MKKVTAGIIIADNKILIAQRRKAPEDLWEFPGGKIEAGETAEDCLAREIKEEFDINVRVGKFLMESAYEYEFGSFNLLAYFAFPLDSHFHIHNTVHKDYKWVTKDNLSSYEFCPADIPIVEKLKSLSF